MYSCSLSQASGMDSIPVCWKLDIFPRRAFILPSGKNFARNALEHLAQVSMSFSLLNHYFPQEGKGKQMKLDNVGGDNPYDNGVAEL